MNKGQQQFFNFIMERVTEEGKSKAEALLKESFEKQANGTFNKEYIQAFIPEMLGLLKPEHFEEVKNIMLNYES